MSKFDVLDREIVAAIASGRTRFSELQGGEIWKLADAIGPKDRGTVDVGRVVDRRLQALRKRGVIAYGSGRWIVAHNSGQVCPHCHGMLPNDPPGTGT